MNEQLIPARMNVRRDPLDSAFLQRYAQRREGRAKWMLTIYALWGGLAGFGLGSAFVAVWAWAQMFKGAGINIATLFGQATQPVVEPMVYGIPLYWIPFMMAGVGAIVWGMRGVGRSDEVRFQAQIALHLIRLCDVDRL